MKANDILKIVMVVIIVAMGSFFYYKYLLNPKIIEIRDLNEQISTKKTELETYIKVRKNKADVLIQNINYKNWITSIYKIIPKEFNNSSNISMVTDLLQLGGEMGVEFSSLDILDPSIGGGIAKTDEKTSKRISKNNIGINFTIETNNYQNLKKFNDTLLNNFKNIIIPESYTVSTSKVGVKGTGSVTLELVYTEIFAGYLLLAPDAVMPVAIKK